MSFVNELEEAIKEANEAAEKAGGGDPATHVTAEVDGRTEFASKMKEEGDKKRGKYVVKTGEGTVKMNSDDYGIHVDFLSGTDIQLHKKKLAGYKAFKDHMEKKGYSMGNDFIDTYSR